MMGYQTANGACAVKAARGVLEKQARVILPGQQIGNIHLDTFRYCTSIATMQFVRENKLHTNILVLMLLKKKCSVNIKRLC